MPQCWERAARFTQSFAALLNAIVKVLGLGDGKDWLRVRRELTDEQIGEVYHLYEGLWPRETDMLQLLPKPDGTARAVYTGAIHPSTIYEFAYGASLYFGELLVQHPFMHAGTMKKEFSPVENPGKYRQEFIKTVHFFLNIMPLVDAGFINLFPDPCNFDDHLRDQMFHMAKSRAADVKVDLRQDPGLDQVVKEDLKRSMMELPRDALRTQVRRSSPELDDAKLEDVMSAIERLRERDPLAVLHGGRLKDGGQLGIMKLSPNFEIAMYLAQATGACIVTDSHFRWNEITRAIRLSPGGPDFALDDLAQRIARAEFAFPQDVPDIMTLADNRMLSGYPDLMRDIFKYLAKLSDRGAKPNWETHASARFAKMHAPAQVAIKKSGIAANLGRISCAFPAGGIQDNTVNRLLLMSNSELHLPRVPMAFFFEAQSPVATATAPFLPLSD